MRPIIKHPGGKRRFARRILDALGSPDELCEPFAGGLAVSLEGSRPRFVAEVIPAIRSLYQMLASAPSVLWDELDGMPRDVRTKGEYMEMRSRFNRCQSPGLYVALNYACFNGLSRFNRSGGFNAPVGGPFPRRIPRFTEMRRAYEVLFKGCEVFVDWRDAVSAAADAGVKIYADPPYVGTFSYAGAVGSWGLDELAELAVTVPIGSAISERLGETDRWLKGAGFELAETFEARNSISRGERTRRRDGLWIKTKEIGV